MKKNILFLSLTCFYLTSYSQGPISPQASPTRQVGWVINENLSNLQKTSDGGIIGCNTQTKKYSEAGILQFSLPFAYKYLLPTSDGGYIMGINTNAAQTSLTNYYGGYDTWIVKINASGVIQWQQSLSGTGDDNLESMKLNSNGDLIVLLSSNSTTNFGVGNQGGKDLWLVHLSSIGTLTKINLGGSADETFKNLETISSTESLVCLTTSSQSGVFNQGFKGSIDTWVLKITKGVNLSITQKRAYGGSADDEGSLSISNSKYLISGYSKSGNGDLSINKGLKDLWICFINPDGTLISSNNYGGSGDDFIRDAYFNTVDNAFYILGDNNSTDGDFPNSSPNSAVQDRLFKFSNTGIFNWRRDFYIGRPYGNIPLMIKLSNQSGFLISGLLSTNEGYSTNLFTPANVSTYASSFFCKLSSIDGSTEWFKQPTYGRNYASISILGNSSDGNILCTTTSNASTSGISRLFTIDSQGVSIKTNFDYPCPAYSYPSPYNPQIYCVPPPLSGISGDNGVIFTQYYSSSPTTRKVCPQVYAGTMRQYKLYCNTSLGDTLRVPNDNEFTYQWKRNGIAVSGATSPKYYATQTGKYTVEISGKTCTGKAETDTIVLALATNEVVTPKLKTVSDSTVCLGDTVKMTIFDGCNYGFLQWQKDGVDISGETSLNYQTTQSGIYRVKVTTNGFITYTNSKTVTINSNCCVMKSITNGNWESPSTWSCQRIPNETDDVIINGHQINVTTNSAKAKKVIYQGGRVHFTNNTAKLLIKNN